MQAQEDRVEAVTAPLAELAGLRSQLEGRSSRHSPTRDLETLVRSEVESEPSREHHFPDLDLHVWDFEDPIRWQGASLDPGWMVFRVLRADENP